MIGKQPRQTGRRIRHVRGDDGVRQLPSGCVGYLTATIATPNPPRPAANFAHLRCYRGENNAYLCDSSRSLLQQTSMASVASSLLTPRMMRVHSARITLSG